MASIRKRGAGWHVEVFRNGTRKSGTFGTKKAAEAWAFTVESEIMAGKRGQIPNKTFGQLLEKYRDEISVGKRGERWEHVRIERMVNGRPKDTPSVPPDPICAVGLADLNETHVAAWRDRRLRQVTPASVRREWTLLSHACSVAVKEWKWLNSNPMSDVRRPAPATGRDRRISADEIERLMFALGYDAETPPGTQTARVGAAFLFAIETAMRAGEIVALQWKDVFLEGSFVTVTGAVIGAGKSVAARRNVALSSAAIRVLKQLQEISEDNKPVFRISSTQTIDALFRKSKAKAMIEDLHFHDTRHEAITRLAKKLGVLDLARMVGHRDLRQLSVYYNETATEMAAKLD